MARASSSSHPHRRLSIFTKPAVPGRVKTRLVGDLSAGEAAALHAAFLGDLAERLATGAFELELAWALAPGEAVPEYRLGDGRLLPGVRQQGADLGERLFTALAAGARRAPLVAAVGSDHPTLATATVEAAFDHLEAGARVVLGPATDGGYTLVAVRAEALARELFAEVPWSTERVLAVTLERCAALGEQPALLPPAADVDTPADLLRLAAELASHAGLCPRTRGLLAAWGRLPVAVLGGVA